MKIRKKDTVMRFAISSRVRLAITLRFIGTGDSYRSLEFLSRVSRKIIGQFVPEVLEAIIEALQDECLKVNAKYGFVFHICNIVFACSYLPQPTNGKQSPMASKIGGSFPTH